MAMMEGGSVHAQAINYSHTWTTTQVALSSSPYANLQGLHWAGQWDKCEEGVDRHLWTTSDHLAMTHVGKKHVQK